MGDTPLMEASDMQQPDGPATLLRCQQMRHETEAERRRAPGVAQLMGASKDGHRAWRSCCLVAAQT